MEVVNDRISLESQFHRLVRGMAYANGRFNDEAIECLKCCGIAYARTTISTGDFRLPSDWYRLTATCHYGDAHLMELAHKFVEEKARKDGGRDTIWYATNIEIYDYIEAYRKLIFSMERSFVYNPTTLEVFFEINGEIGRELCTIDGTHPYLK